MTRTQATDVAGVPAVVAVTVVTGFLAIVGVTDVANVSAIVGVETENRIYQYFLLPL